MPGAGKGNPWDAAKRLFSRGKPEAAEPDVAGAPQPERRAEPPRRAPARAQLVDDDHDRLTGVLNSQAIHRELDSAAAAALSEGEAIAYALVEVDNFAALVEEHGRMRVDQSLREIATRLGDCVREHDRVGRLDGPRFAVVFRGLAARMQSLALVARLRMRLAEPVLINGRPIQPAASAGVVNFGIDGKSADALRAAAGPALAKSREQARLSALAAAEAARLKAEAAAAAAEAAAAEPAPN